MPCHQTSYFCIILINCINLYFLPVTDNYKRDFLCNLAHLFHKYRTWITGIYNACRVYTRHQLEILFFEFQFSLCITGKNTVSLFFRHCFNSLKQHDIIRIGKGWAKYNNQLPIPAVLSLTPFWDCISHFLSNPLNFFHCFF